jgi:hypothetical protein
MHTPLNIHTAQTLLHVTFHHSSSKYGNEHLDSMRVFPDHLSVWVSSHEGVAFVELVNK